MAPERPEPRTSNHEVGSASNDADPTQAATSPEPAVSGLEEEWPSSREATQAVPEQRAVEVEGHTEAEALEGDLVELQAKARERDEYLALAQRAQADFENYRKRTSKDVVAAEARGVAKLARELLPALDNLALATAESSTETEHEDGLLDGIRLVQSELMASLQRLGIEAYSPEGERFDPELHEAMAQQEVQGAEPGTIVAVYQPGYRYRESLLRPARVVVAQ